MFQKNVIYLIFAAFVSILSGCSETSQPGSEYIGAWVRVDDSERMMEIKQSGENFIIKRSGGFFNGEMSAALKDGMLVTPDMASFNIDKTTGTLKTEKGVAYKRVK